MANTTNTKQQIFATSVLMAMDQLKASGLKKLAERGNATGGETYTFYRKKKATAQNDIPTMYGSTHSSNGGDFDKFIATISQISSQDKLKEADEKKTKLDLKSPIVASMTNAVLLKEDSIIIEAIKGKDSELKKIGTATKTSDDIVNIRALISAVRSAHVWAKCGLDQKKGVGIVMNEDDYTTLSTSEIFINGDYKEAFGGGTGDVPLTFFGAEIIISESIEKGTMYIIPSYTFGFASWENSVGVDKIFVPTDGRQWHLQVYESVGCVVIEPTKITKFSVKP